MLAEPWRVHQIPQEAFECCSAAHWTWRRDCTLINQSCGSRDASPQTPWCGAILPWHVPLTHRHLPISHRKGEICGFQELISCLLCRYCKPCSFIMSFSENEDIIDWKGKAGATLATRHQLVIIFTSSLLVSQEQLLFGFMRIQSLFWWSRQSVKAHQRGDTQVSCAKKDQSPIGNYESCIRWRHITQETLLCPRVRIRRLQVQSWLPLIFTISFFLFSFAYLHC